MRVLLMVQQAHQQNPNFTEGDLADKVMERFGASRPTAWRRIRQAMDVLCIHYAPSPQRIAQRTAEGQSRKRLTGWKPGRPTQR